MFILHFTLFIIHKFPSSGWAWICSILITSSLKSFEKFDNEIKYLLYVAVRNRRNQFLFFSCQKVTFLKCLEEKKQFISCFEFFKYWFTSYCVCPSEPVQTSLDITAVSFYIHLDCSLNEKLGNPYLPTMV